MERRFYLILLTIISFCFVKINAEEVSQQQAFEIVSKLFEGQGVDYYTITAKDNSDIDKWMFFIDMIPSALWSHPCYVVKYPKTGHVQEDAFEKAQYSFPPEEYEYTPYPSHILQSLFRIHGKYRSPPQFHYSRACSIPWK